KNVFIRHKQCTMYKNKCKKLYTCLQLKELRNKYYSESLLTTSLSWEADEEPTPNTEEEEDHSTWNLTSGTGGKADGLSTGG
ncbi:hypothetical protein L2V44_14260, partial [Staphylococcus aureus]|nr:hypothetical protein [Staphylococcus aureus]